MRIATDIPDIVFTSDVKTVACESTSTVVEVSLHATSEIYHARLATVDGVVKIHALNRLIEAYMRDEDIICAPFRIRFESTSETAVEATFTAIYCTHSVNIEPATLVSDHFLSTLSTRRTYKGAKESLTYICAQGETSPMVARVTLRAGNNLHTVDITAPMPEATSTEVRVINTGYEAIEAIIAASNMPEVSYDEIVGYTVRIGSRTTTYYVDRGAPTWSVAFRNAFNATEYLHLRGATTSKSSTTGGETVCDNELVQYDRLTVKTHEVESGALLPEEALWMEQLFASHHIEDSRGRIVLTDNDITYTDRDGEAITIKLTWRYADNRGWLSLPENTAKIFNDKFDYTFC